MRNQHGHGQTDPKHCHSDKTGGSCAAARCFVLLCYLRTHFVFALFAFRISIGTACIQYSMILPLPYRIVPLAYSLQFTSCYSLHLHSYVLYFLINLCNNCLKNKPSTKLRDLLRCDSLLQNVGFLFCSVDRTDHNLGSVY